MLLLNEQGKIIGRLQAEEALRRSEKTINTFMDSATDDFFIFDSNLNYIKVTHPEHYKLTQDEMLGKNIADISPSSKTSGRYDEYLKVIETGIPFTTEDEIKLPNMLPTYYSIRAFKVDDGLGVIVTDVTERKKNGKRPAFCQRTG